MPAVVMKQATQELHKQGVKLTVKRGLWGYYLDDPNLAVQRSRYYPTTRQCIEAALAGERPTALEETNKEE